MIVDSSKNTAHQESSQNELSSKPNVEIFPEGLKKAISIAPDLMLKPLSGGGVFSEPAISSLQGARVGQSGLKNRMPIEFLARVIRNRVVYFKSSDLEIASILKLQFGENKQQAYHFITRVCHEVSQSYLLDPLMHAVEPIMSEYEAILLEDAQSFKVNFKADVDIDLKIMPRKIFERHTGTILDRTQAVAAYFKDARVARDTAREAVHQLINHLNCCGLLDRVILPLDVDIDAAFAEGFHSAPTSIRSEWVTKPLSRERSISQSLRFNDLKEDVWFKTHRPDLTGRPEFTGVSLDVQPGKIQVSVVNPQNVPDYLGNFDPKERNTPEKSDRVPDFYAPMLLPQEWATRAIRPEGGSVSLEEVQGSFAVMNCGWFNLLPSGVGDLESKERINAHSTTGTFPLGPLVVEKKVLANHELSDKGQILDALILRNGAAHIASAEMLKADARIYLPQEKDKSLYAIGGFQILKDGQPITTPKNNNPTLSMPRSGVGIKPNPNGSMVFSVVGTGLKKIGVTAREFSDYFKSLGCTQAINLDNSGSAAMSIMGREGPLSGKQKMKTTVGSDFVTMQDGKTVLGRKNRPIPLVLLIKPRASSHEASTTERSMAKSNPI